MKRVEEEGLQFRIRSAVMRDQALLAEVGSETFRDTFAPDNASENMAAYLAAAFSPEQQAFELADPANLFLIAEAESEVVGYARLKLGEAPAAIVGDRPVEIARLYARKPWIGKGVGRKLMQACLDSGRKQGRDVMWLDVWERNARAIGFYSQWGFVEVGSQIFRLGDDLQRDLLMARAVALS